MTGALSGSWWAGDLNDQGVPRGTQRLGSPRGYYQIEFDGSDYVDTYHTFNTPADDQLHASFSTPRFRKWADDLLTYVNLYGVPSDVMPPVTVNDLGDMNMLTRADLEGGTWVAINVWNGSTESRVSISINGGASLEATRTQAAEGEEKGRGPEFADPYALAQQATVGRMTFRSAKGGDATAGFNTWRGTEWKGVAGPLQGWMLSYTSQHLWKVDLPANLPAGSHVMEIKTTDRYGRTFSEKLAFEIVEQLPDPKWQASFFE